MTKIHFTKFHSNIPAVNEHLKHSGSIPSKDAKITTEGKSYKVTKIETIQRGTGDLIGCRLLGGLLVALSFGLLYFYNQEVKELFEKKYFFVTAILDKTPIGTTAEKTQHVSLSPLIQPDHDQPVLKPQFNEQEIIKNKKLKPMTDAQIDRLVKPATTPRNQFEEKQSAPYLLVADGPRQQIASYLSLKDLQQLSKVSIGTKRIVDETLTTDVIQIEVFVKLYLKKTVSPKQFKRFVKNSPATDLLNAIQTVLIKPSELKEDFLKKLEPHVRESFLKALIELLKDPSTIQEVYKKFASHQAKLAFVAKQAETPKRAVGLNLYENWADELRKGVNFEIKKEKDTFYKLILDLIIPSHLNIERSIDLTAYPVIDQEMPDLTISEFTQYTLELQKENDFRYFKAPPALAAFRCFKLCKKLNGDKLREAFTTLYLEGIKECPAAIKDKIFLSWEGLTEWNEIFEYSLRGFLREIDYQADIVRKVVYAINGSAKFSRWESDETSTKFTNLQVIFMANIRYWRQSGFQNNKNLYQTGVIAALKEFTRSHRDTTFAPVFYAPFHWIKTNPEVRALIHEVKKFEEPAHSLYFRAIAHGVRYITKKFRTEKLSLSSDQIMEAFANAEVAFPKGGIVYELEFIKHASSLSRFIKTVNEIQNGEDFKRALADILSLDSSQVKEARLQVLANGTEFLDFRAAYQMSKHQFALDQLIPLTLNDLETLDQSFRDNLMGISSETEFHQLIEENEENLIKLRALASHVYHLFDMSKVLIDERRSIFREKGLNIDQYAPFDQKEWLEIEEKDFFLVNNKHINPPPS